MTPGQPADNGPDLLKWYAEMGVDEAIGDDPVDRYKESEAQAARASKAAEKARAEPETKRAPARPAPRAPAAAPVSDAAGAAEELGENARVRADYCETLDELRAALEAFDECGLKRTAKNLVFCDGTAGSSIMFIGEAPGRDEDLQGKSFVGRSGQLLDRMLTAIGLDRTSVYIANVIYWRPPGNRDPTAVEMAQCRPFIRRQIELAKPDFLVPIGSVPARELLQTTTGILRLRGHWRSCRIGERDIPVLPTLHPAYLLRQPAQKKLAWRDFMELRRALDGGDINVN